MLVLFRPIRQYRITTIPLLVGFDIISCRIVQLFIQHVHTLLAFKQVVIRPYIPNNVISVTAQKHIVTYFVHI